jgi:hypothetical protein
VPGLGQTGAAEAVPPAVDLDQIRARWPEALDAVRSAAGAAGQRALAAYFGDAEPTATDGGRLTLRFGPRQRLWLEYCGTPDRRELLASVVGGVLGRPVALHFELAEGDAADPLTDPTRTRALRAEVEAARADPAVAAAIKLFGGRIIDVQKGNANPPH